MAKQSEEYGPRSPDYGLSYEPVVSEEPTAAGRPRTPPTAALPSATSAQHESDGCE